MPCDLSALARRATAEALAKEGINYAMKLPWLRMAGHPPMLSQRESYGEDQSPSRSSRVNIAWE
jgi:hypothetical protein